VRNLARILFVIVALALAAWALIARPNLTAAERGHRVAERWGCFGCHGPGGIRGVPNHARLDRTVPGFEGDVMMYAKDDTDIREWIRDGVSARKKVSQTWQAERKKGALRMPAYGRLLGSRQIDDLVAYVNACAGNPEPESAAAAAGLRKARQLGCTGCHGPGGRLAMRNPGSLKGYIPSWDSADFPLLVENRAQFGEWVENGVSEHLRGNAAAMYLLRRAAVHMPHFKEHVGPGDVDSLWAYVTWLRSTPH
jgi:mono/diheme cytochrome c family protein